MNTLTNLVSPGTFELKSQLSDFGLQPQEWAVIKSNSAQFRIQHKNEKSFYFVGSVEKVKGKKVWKSITLASL